MYLSCLLEGIQPNMSSANYKERFSQVFLREETLVRKLVDQSSIGPEDVVVEIGPGKGIITRQLLEQAGKVIAVEKDVRLFEELQSRYRGNSRIELHLADILQFPLPAEPYKVFSNIPFAIEGKLTRLLMDSPHPPKDSYLIMRREVAERFAGEPREGVFSITHKPWLDLSIFYRFRRSDFVPQPKVESVGLRFRRREEPLIDGKQKRLYELFVRQGFGSGRTGNRTIEKNLEPLLSSPQLVQLAKKWGFKSSDSPSQLHFEQWLGIFAAVVQLPESGKQQFIQWSMKGR